VALRVDSLGCRISDAIGAKRTCRERRERVDRTKVTPTAWTGRALQAESTLALLYPALAWSRSLLAIMDIRARPISFSDRPSKASWVTRSRTRRRDRSPLLKSNSQTSAGVSYDQAAQGLTEAIPSEPPSLARLIGERRERRGMAVIPLVNQSELIPLISYRCCAETRLVYTMLCKHAPRDAGQLVG
jgi:hypothetical protein